ncbi:methionyl-tRNA formyltransferase [Campylobacter sp. LR291e]|uniref:formyltransferase family protein n=1 Tax=Campylobacter sp. LR291e TaxID=2593546 RepID=UPI00123AB56A|nr:formyltransferase family protein [Campylobacter sp. LR291e]KAA6230927.1 methionyl-tRNA formyltransferase [Campylobacter sp. LR291e]
MKIAILTSKNQWFIPFAKKLNKKIKDSKLFYSHDDIKDYDIVFILSYHKIIDKKTLLKNKENVVIHASNLPAFKGFAPMFYQILKNYKNIVFSCLKADINVDSGDIYFKKTLRLKGDELYDELRTKQGEFVIKLCLHFLKLYPNFKLKKQNGVESFCKKRNPKDSELNIKKSINSQFNLLRICSNEEFPAFFYKNGKKYILKIYRQD